jgi:hypothetical protein
LKVPDGASGNTKCPKCGTVFPVSAPAAPASPPPPAAPAPASRPVMKPVQKAEEPDYEEVDEKPKKRSRADDDDDDDDDRPRKKKRSRADDDDDDDEPRSKKKNRSRDDDDDDDDDDDRPRRKKGKKKKASRDDDDDDDDDFVPKKSSKGAAFAKAKTGSNLIAIGFWLNLGAYGVLALYALIMWVMYLSASSGSSSRRSSGSSGDGSFMDVVVMLPGLVGLGGWIVGIVGTSFAIAGPKKARAMAITATALAGVHLLLTGVTFSNMQDGVGLPVPGLRKIGWIAMATTLWAVDALLPVLFYFSKGLDGDFTLAILAGICEIGRLIFMLLTLKALASAARDNDAAEKAQSGVMLTSFITGGAALLTLLVFIVIYEAKSSSLVHLGFLTMILIFVGYTFMMLPAAMAAMQTRDACDR